MHCQKYPYAIFYEAYDAENCRLAEPAFAAMIKKEVLKHIDRVGYIKLSAASQKPNEAAIIRDMKHDTSLTEHLDSFGDIEEKHLQAKRRKMKPDSGSFVDPISIM